MTITNIWHSTQILTFDDQTLEPKSTVFHHNLNFKHVCDKSHVAQWIQQPIPKLQILISTNLSNQIDFYSSNKIKLAVIGQHNSCKFGYVGRIGE